MKNYAIVPYDFKDDNGILVKKGNMVTFHMPSFCSGDYTFEVVELENGQLVFKDAPTMILEGCHGCEIKKG